MPEPTYQELVDLVASQVLVIAAQAELIEKLTARIAELERRLGADSSNSSRPPSSDSPYTKKVAKTRSSRQRSGRKPGKQPGDPGVSRSLTDHPDKTIRIDPDTCTGCNGSLAGSTPRTVERRQVVDLPPVPAPVITEYRLGASTCRCCGVETTAEWTDLTDIPDTPAHTDVLAGPGSPVRIGPRALAMCAFLTCGHYLPVGRATALLETMTGLHLATGFTARARRRAAKKLLATFLPHMKDLLATAPILHADETTGRAAGALAYVHVACTEYLTLMHVAWCGAHLIRDLRSISDADPEGQLWAIAMADTLTAANKAACQAREQGRDRLDEQTLATLMNHYLGALAKGRTDNLGHTGEVADKARTLIRRFHRYQDMILRYTTDLAVPWTNNQAERDARPVKIQQRTSGGCWRTLAGLTEFATVHSYLSTATKWGKDKLDALTELFTTGPWLPPTLAPS